MAYGIYNIEGKGAEGQNKKIFCKKKKEENASYLCSQAHIRKDREGFFFGFCDFIIFFKFLGYFCSTLLENNRFCFVPLFIPIQYITYPVLTSTNFYPLFKGRDTAIFNFSIYHVFILGM